MNEQIRTEEEIEIAAQYVLDDIKRARGMKELRHDSNGNIYWKPTVGVDSTSHEQKVEILLDEILCELHEINENNHIELRGICDEIRLLKDVMQAR